MLTRMFPPLASFRRWVGKWAAIWVGRNQFLFGLRTWESVLSPTNHAPTLK